jgi:DNA-binding response OmpR family regulator
MATPLIAVVEADPKKAWTLAWALEGAGYRVTWYRQVEHLLDEVMEFCPDVVLLASRRPRHYDRWQAASDLRVMGCAVIMATADDAATREVGVSPRGRAFVDVVRVPYVPGSVLSVVAHTLATYPYAVALGA